MWSASGVPNNFCLRNIPVRLKIHMQLSIERAVREDKIVFIHNLDEVGEKFTFSTASSSDRRMDGAYFSNLYAESLKFKHFHQSQSGCRCHKKIVLTGKNVKSSKREWFQGCLIKAISKSGQGRAASMEIDDAWTPLWGNHVISESTQRRSSLLPDSQQVGHQTFGVH